MGVRNADKGFSISGFMDRVKQTLFPELAKMPKPIVAVTSDLKEFEPYIWNAVPSVYAEAASKVSDVIPMILPSIGEELDIDSLLDRIDGVLVTGSRSNVHPSNYRQEETESHGPFDPARDATTLPLIRRAIERGVPVLAICRGIQELNVAMGGTLTADFQSVRNIDGHDYPKDGTLDERFGLSHGLKIEDGSCLATILEEEIAKGPVMVNSVHGQALDQLGENIVVEAVNDADGTIEAVTVSGAPGYVVGVQWHPEYWAETDSTSNKILASFGDAARIYLAQKSDLSVAAE